MPESTQTVWSKDISSNQNTLIGDIHQSNSSNEIIKQLSPTKTKTKQKQTKQKQKQKTEQW